MKYIVTLFVLLLQISCTQDETKIIKTSSISFSLSPKAQTIGRVADTGTPAAVMLSIKDADGNLVYENKKLSLFTFGQGYMSEGMQMKVVGSATDYTLVTFLVLDANGKTLYASPTAGSPKAKLVSKPLPLKFTISENDNTAIVPEVLAVEDTDTPESFGYASFGFEVVKDGRRKIRFELYTDQDFSTDTHIIIFKARIFGRKSEIKSWDSAFAPMLIKDIPGAGNKIVFEKYIPHSDTLGAGFDYEIVDVGYSWYHQLVLPNEASKTLSFDFK